MRFNLLVAMLAAGAAFLPAAADDPSPREDAKTCNAPYLNPDDAIAACQRLLPVLSPEQRAHAYVNLGNAFSNRQRWDEAIQALDAALALAPDLPTAYNARGTAHKAKYEYAAAIADFTASIDLDGKNFGALANRCEARSEAGIDLAAALDDCDAALRLFPMAKPIYGQRALVLLRLGRFADAIADYDKGIAASPNAPYFLFGRGIAKARIGDKDGSDADLAAARRLDAGIGARFASFGLGP